MSSYYVLAATGGLVILHASQVQPKNTSSVLIANLLSIAVATLAYWACGFAFAIGDGKFDAKGDSTTSTSNFFLAHTRFFLMDAGPTDYTAFVENVIILGLVVVIVNSGFISRMRCYIYPIIITIVAGFLYPCVYHWTNAQNGWLVKGIAILVEEKGLNKEKFLVYKDAFGSGYIHVFGGSCALIASILVGARKERRGKKFLPLGGNFNPLIVVGGILALVGLVAKNSAGGPLGVINNLLAGQASALVAFIFKRCKYFGDTSGTKALINGALAGVVGVSCAAHEYEPWYAFVVGVVAGLAYVVWSTLFQLCHVDDPTDSVAVHLGAGLWAILAAPIFRKDVGIIVGGETFAFKTFGWHLLGELAIFVWAGLTLFIICIPFLAARVITYRDEDAVTRGLDAFELTDPAFPDRNSSDYDASNLLDEIMPVKAGSFKVASYDNTAIHATIEGQNQWGYCNDNEWGAAKY